jgi:hypothetical protein
VLIVALSCLSACSDRISGTYSDKQGVATYEFDRNGRINITVLGTNVAAEYAVDGDRILVTSPQGTIVLTRQGDQLLGPMGLELNLQRDQAMTPGRSDEKRKRNESHVPDSPGSDIQSRRLRIWQRIP